MNQSLPMCAFCIQRSQIWIHRSRGLFSISESSNVDDFCLLQTFALSLNTQKWFLVGNPALKIGLIEPTFHRKYKRRTLAGSGLSLKWSLMQLDNNVACLWSQFCQHHFWWSRATGRFCFYGVKMMWVRNFSEYGRHLF
jgi:hypothetical protein